MPTITDADKPSILDRAEGSIITTVTATGPMFRSVRCGNIIERKARMGVSMMLPFSSYRYFLLQNFNKDIVILKINRIFAMIFLTDNC